MKTTRKDVVTSEYIKVVDREAARRGFRAVAAEEVERLERALAAGWDVAKDLERAREQLRAFFVMIEL